MRFFPSSLTKNAFTWFANLRPYSILTWNQLEKCFHEQFFRGEMKVSLTDLFTVRRGLRESIDDYLARFRMMKNWCFIPIPESEMAKIATNGLDYSIRKKLVDLQFLDLAQLVEKVQQIEQLKMEKERSERTRLRKTFSKEQVNFIEMELDEEEDGFDSMK